MARFTSTDRLPSQTRHACNRALHHAGLPTLGSARTVEAYLAVWDFDDAALPVITRTLRTVGLRVPRAAGSHR